MAHKSSCSLYFDKDQCDGSLRIIYDETSAHANGTNSTDRLALTNQKYNANYNDAKYIGYIYGPSGTISSPFEA